MERYLQYTELFLSIGLALVGVLALIVLGDMWLGEMYAKGQFFKAAKRSLRFSNTIESMKGIVNDYEVYKRRRSGFSSKNIIELCQELGVKMKSDEGSYGINTLEKLDEIISLYKDDYRFDDDKMNEVIENIRKLSNEDDARNVREYLIKVNAYHTGIVFEKERQITDALTKMNRRKWWNRFCTLIGLIGSIASIYSIM